MPGRFCIIRSCSSSDAALIKYNRSICNVHHVIRKQCICPAPYKLRSFPSNKEKFKLWCVAIKDEVPNNYYPKAGHRICSRHFTNAEDLFPTENLVSGNDNSPLKKKGGKNLTDERRVQSNITNDDQYENEALARNFLKTFNMETQTNEAENSVTEIQTNISKKLKMETTIFISVCDASTQWEDDINDKITDQSDITTNQVGATEASTTDLVSATPIIDQVAFTTNIVDQVATTCTTYQAKMEGFRITSTCSLAGALNSIDKRLLISDVDKQINETKMLSITKTDEFENCRKVWLEKEISKGSQLNGKTHSLFIQHLLDVHKSWCLSCNELNEVNNECCIQNVKAEPVDFINDDNCEQITPD